MVNSILRLPAVKVRMGLSRSTLYARIRQGTFIKSISLGARAVGWPSKEIDILNDARIAGKSDDEIRELVIRLEKARKSEVIL